MQGNPTSHQIGGRLTRVVQTRKRRCLLAGRWSSVHICTCRVTHRNVSLQVQAYEINQNVQGLETLNLLSI